VVTTDGLILRHVSAGLAQEPHWSDIDRLPQASAQESLSAGHRVIAWNFTH
jgi:hypothetical protein